MLILSEIILYLHNKHAILFTLFNFYVILIYIYISVGFSKRIVLGLLVHVMI